MTSDSLHVYMAKDPETDRVFMQRSPITRSHLPAGLRGEGWPLREGEVSQATWDLVLAGTLPADDIDLFHRDAWTRNGDTPWPL